MLKNYQSIYVAFYRWNFKNFGLGRLPEFKSLFNISFLMIALLTNLMLVTQLLIKSHLIVLNSYSGTVILFGAVSFMFFNHLILLNNKLFVKINLKLARLNRHNLNVWSVVLMLNVIVTCGLFLMTIR